MDKDIRKELKLRKRNLKEKNKKLYSKSKHPFLRKLLIVSVILIITIPSFFYINEVIDLKESLGKKNEELSNIEKDLNEKKIELSEIKKDKNLEFSVRENLRYVGEGEIYFEFESED